MCQNSRLRKSWWRKYAEIAIWVTRHFRWNDRLLLWRHFIDFVASNIKFDFLPFKNLQHYMDVAMDSNKMATINWSADNPLPGPIYIPRSPWTGACLPSGVSKLGHKNSRETAGEQLLKIKKEATRKGWLTGLVWWEMAGRLLTFPASVLLVRSQKKNMVKKKEKRFCQVV